MYYVPVRTDCKTAFDTLYRISSNLIVTEGEVALGALFNALIRGEPWCCAVSVEPTRAAANSIAGLSDIDIQGVYELVLSGLEDDYGPLYCEDTENRDDNDGGPAAVIWGWAGPIEDQSVISPLKTRGEDLLQRCASLDQGHPDAYRDFSAKSLPATIWRPLNNTNR